MTRVPSWVDSSSSPLEQQLLHWWQDWVSSEEPSRKDLDSLRALERLIERAIQEYLLNG